MSIAVARASESVRSPPRLLMPVASSPVACAVTDRSVTSPVEFWKIPVAAPAVAALQVTCAARNPAASLRSAIASAAAVFSTVSDRSSAFAAPAIVPVVSTVERTIVTPSPEPSMSTNGFIASVRSRRS